MARTDPILEGLLFGGAIGVFVGCVMDIGMFTRKSKARVTAPAALSIGEEARLALLLRNPPYNCTEDEAMKILNGMGNSAGAMHECIARETANGNCAGLRSYLLKRVEEMRENKVTERTI